MHRQQNAHRTAIAARYLQTLDGIPDLLLPKVLPECSSAWHLFVIRHPERDRIAKALAEAGIGTLVHYPIAPHLQQAYEYQAPPKGLLQVAESLQSEVLSLPIGPTLPLADADRVADCLREKLTERTA